MLRVTRRTSDSTESTARRLAVALSGVWNQANDVLACVEDGTACYNGLVIALNGIADEAAQALADVVRLEVTDAA